MPVARLEGGVVEEGHFGRVVIFLDDSGARDNIEFRYTVRNVSAIHGEDYDAYFGLPSGTVYLPFGNFLTSISFLSIDDEIPEGDETFEITITEVTDNVVFPGGASSLTATVTIVDNDTPLDSLFSVEYPVDGSTLHTWYGWVWGRATPGTVVSVTAQSGSYLASATATPASDGYWHLSLRNHPRPFGDFDISVTAVGTDGTQAEPETLSITRRSPFPLASVSAWPPGAAVEEGSEAVFMLQLSPFGPQRAIGIGFTVSDSPGNYIDRGSQPTSPVTIEPIPWFGGSEQYAAFVRIPTVDDSSEEADGTITLTLSRYSGKHYHWYTISGRTASVTVRNNDFNLPTASVTPVAARVPERAGAQAQFDISLDQTPTRDIEVAYSLPTDQQGAWATPGADYQTPAATNRTVSFSQGTTNLTQRVSLPITDDALNERNETIRLTLDRDTLLEQDRGYTINRHDSSSWSASVLIQDADPPPIAEVTPLPETAQEGEDLRFRVTLNDPSGQDIPSGRDVYVSYYLRGTATPELRNTTTPATDYTLDSRAFSTHAGTRSTIRIPAGATEAFIEIETIADTDEENSETIRVELIPSRTGTYSTGPRQHATASITDAAVVTLVGFEVTQGTQDWQGSVDLIASRLTAVRAFFTVNEPGLEEGVEVTADLYVSHMTSSGVRPPYEKPFKPINTNETLHVQSSEIEHNCIADNSRFEVTNCRADIDSSLNFMISLPSSYDRRLTLEFPDDLLVVCEAAIAPDSDCANGEPFVVDIEFRDLNTPTMVMLAGFAGATGTSRYQEEPAEDTAEADEPEEIKGVGTRFTFEMVDRLMQAGAADDVMMVFPFDETGESYGDEDDNDPVSVTYSERFDDDGEPIRERVYLGLNRDGQLVAASEPDRVAGEANRVVSGLDDDGEAVADALVFHDTEEGFMATVAKPDPDPESDWYLALGPDGGTINLNVSGEATDRDEPVTLGEFEAVATANRRGRYDFRENYFLRPEVSDAELLGQWYRIKSMLPFLNWQYESVVLEDFTGLNFIYHNDTSNHALHYLEEYKKDAKRYDNKQFVMGLVMPSASMGGGVARVRDDEFTFAVWDVGSSPADPVGMPDDLFGYGRTNGVHEIAHALGQPHTYTYDRNTKRSTGFCQEGPDNNDSYSYPLSDVASLSQLAALGVAVGIRPDSAREVEVRGQTITVVDAYIDVGNDGFRDHNNNGYFDFEDEEDIWIEGLEPRRPFEPHEGPDADQLLPQFHPYQLRRYDLPLLGPLGSQNENGNWLPVVNPDTEVWGLDIDTLRLRRAWQENRHGRPQLESNADSIIVANPRHSFATVSYCEVRGEVQLVWLDRISHERILEQMSRVTTQPEAARNAVLGAAGEVPTDMISGSFSFSEADGTVSEVDLNRVYARPRTPDPVRTTGKYVLELRDSQGTALRSYAFEADPPVAQQQPEDFHAHDLSAYFNLVVPSAPDYASFAIKQNNTVLLTRQRSANTPTVSITGVTASQSFSHADTINLAWTGTDTDGDALTYRVYYSTDHSDDYIPLALETRGTSLQIPANTLRGSNNARIGISVSDGTRSSFTETPVFQVAQHAPQVQIRTPSGQLFANQGFALEGMAYDKEDGLLGLEALSWSSSQDGQLGTGSQVVLATDTMTEGEHTITLTGTDRSGATGTASITITISRTNSVPAAVADTATAELLATVTIDVLANDTDTEGDVSDLRVITPPTLGEAMVRLNPSYRRVIEYTGHTSGTDSFTYEACDGIDRCSATTVTISVGLADCTITGTNDNDTLHGTTGNDIICALGGNDIIYAYGGNDVIRSGQGDDTIYGNQGNDTIYGGLGNDYVLAHQGNDTIYSGPGQDRAYGGSGNDQIHGGTGADQLYGEADNDTIEGNEGDDLIRGGRGGDTLRGGAGDDTIRGNAGADTMHGGPGNDTFPGLAAEDAATQDPPAES